MGQAVIQIGHLRKRYGQTVAVEDVSFEVEEGEIFGLLGPNGAGKTTTVECIQGLRRADGGTIRVRTVSDALPLTHVVKALQDPWLGRGTNPGELLLLAGILVVAGGLALVRGPGH